MIKAKVCGRCKQPIPAIVTGKIKIIFKSNDGKNEKEIRNTDIRLNKEGVMVWVTDLSFILKTHRLDNDRIKKIEISGQCPHCNSINKVHIRKDVKDGKLE